MRLIGRVSKFLWYLNIALVAVVSVIVLVSFDVDRPSHDDAVRVPAARQAADQRNAVGERTYDRVDSRFILERDIFGTGQHAASEQRKEVAMAQSVRPGPGPARELSLRLLGTVVDEQGSSYAILEDRTAKSQDIYRVGDVIADVRVEHIEQNRVVVVNSGVRQVLNLDLTGPVSTAPLVADERSSPPQINVNGNEIVRVISHSERQINTRASAAGIGQATQLLSRVTLSPHMTSGRSDGLRISGLGDSVIGQLAGLRDGDVIQAINGHPVPDQKKAAQVLRKARKLGTARVQFTSGQEMKSLAFHAGAW